MASSTCLPRNLQLLADDVSPVYLCESTSRKSYSCTIPDSLAISELTICEFIRNGNPSLHLELNGMPLKSSDIVCLIDRVNNTSRACGREASIKQKAVESGVDNNNLEYPSEIDVNLNSANLQETATPTAFGIDSLRPWNPRD